MPNIVRVVEAQIESLAPPLKWFEAHWVTKDGREDWAHVCAKDELHAWYKMEKQLKERENG